MQLDITCEQFTQLKIDGQPDFPAKEKKSKVLFMYFAAEAIDYNLYPITPGEEALP